MAIRHLLSLDHLDQATLLHLAERSLAMARNGGRHRPLDGKYVGIYFRRSSTRTRTSFTVGAQRLGATTISFGPSDLQISTGETFADTGRVLSGYLDALVVRTNDPGAEMAALAQQRDMAVVNAMSAEEHPTQAIADLSTIYERFGRFAGLHVLYLGEGNNTAAALALACSHGSGMRLTLMTPAGYGLPEPVLRCAQEAARKNSSQIHQAHDPSQMPSGVDAVYATRWNTMGVSKSDPDWRDKFMPFQVSEEIMERVSKPDGSTVFLHDLPAVRGDDVTDGVLDGPQSLAWRQARYKMWSAMAILEWCLDVPACD
jgi:ornithine carbamoyltransferase